MIIFGVAQGKNPEADKMCLELVYTHLNTKKKIVGVFYQDGYKLTKTPSILIKDIDKGLEIARQHNQSIVIMKTSGFVWSVVDPLEQRPIVNVRFRIKPWSYANEKKHFLYIKDKDKAYIAEELNNNAY